MDRKKKGIYLAGYTHTNWSRDLPEYVCSLALANAALASAVLLNFSRAMPLLPPGGCQANNVKYLSRLNVKFKQKWRIERWKTKQKRRLRHQANSSLYLLACLNNERNHWGYKRK
jgi:hypothetical protein